MANVASGVCKDFVRSVLVIDGVKGFVHARCAAFVFYRDALSLNSKIFGLLSWFLTGVEMAVVNPDGIFLDRG